MTTSLHSRILLALLVAAVAGVGMNALWPDAPALHWFAANVADPAGQIFLRLLFMVVVPLVFTSLAVGVAGIAEVGSLGRMGGLTLGYFAATTLLGAAIGLLLAGVFQPGATIDATTRLALLDAYRGQAEGFAGGMTDALGIQTLVSIVPRNVFESAARGDLLPVIFFALVFGLALRQVPDPGRQAVLRFLRGFLDAVTIMIGYAMRLAPIGVAGLIFAVTARFGFEILKPLFAYLLVLLGGLVLYQFVLLGGLARALGGVQARSFFSRAWFPIVTAFATASSNATLPTTLRTAEDRFGVRNEVAGFVLPLGATMNMNGTALFVACTVVFLAQVFGTPLSLLTLAAITILASITAISAAGIPSGSIPMVIIVLATVGVPPEAIALVLGVDQLTGMARTVPNVTGDLVAALFVTRRLGRDRAPLASQPGTGGLESPGAV